MMTLQQPTLAPSTTHESGCLLRFLCARDRLHQALLTVSRAVAKSSIDIGKMPLLGYIRLEVKEGFLLLAATNLDISITTKVALVQDEKSQEGCVAVPARLFADLISKTPDGCTVMIAVQPDSFLLILEHPRGTAEVKCLSAEEFLPIPGAEDGECPVLLPVVPLKEIIRSVSVAVAKDEALPALACLLVHIDNHKLVFAATDRYRTAHQPLLLPAPGGVTCDLLIPARALTDLASILPNEGMVRMSVTARRGQVIFHTQGLTLSSRLVEGTFPNYQAAIPAREYRQSSVVIKTVEFREIVQLASIYANAGDGAVCLTVKGSLGMEPGTLTVSSERAEIGCGQNAIAAVVEGVDQQEPINFNARLLLDALNVITTVDVQLEIALLKIKSLTAYAGVLKPVGTTVCTHTFMALATTRQ